MSAQTTPNDAWQQHSNRIMENTDQPLRGKTFFPPRLPIRSDELRREVSKLTEWLDGWLVPDDGVSTKSPLDEAITRLRQLGPDVVPILIDHLESLLSTDPLPRYHGDYEHLYKTLGTIRALGEIGDPRAATVVISALDSPGRYSDNLAGHAAEALQHFPSANAIPPLLKALAKITEHSNYNDDIINALVKCDVDAETAWARLQAAPSDTQRKNFGEVFARVVTPATLPRLVELYPNANFFLSGERLKALLSETTGDDRQEVVAVLRQLGQRGSSEALRALMAAGEDVCDDFVCLLQHSPGQTAIRAAFELTSSLADDEIRQNRMLSLLRETRDAGPEIENPTRRIAFDICERCRDRGGLVRVALEVLQPLDRLAPNDLDTFALLIHSESPIRESSVSALRSGIALIRIVLYRSWGKDIRRKAADLALAVADEAYVRKFDEFLRQQGFWTRFALFDFRGRLKAAARKNLEQQDGEATADRPPAKSDNVVGYAFLSLVLIAVLIGLASAVRRDERVRQQTEAFLNQPGINLPDSRLPTPPPVAPSSNDVDLNSHGPGEPDGPMISASLRFPGEVEESRIRVQLADGSQVERDAVKETYRVPALRPTRVCFRNDDIYQFQTCGDILLHEGENIVPMTWLVIVSDNRRLEQSCFITTAENGLTATKGRIYLMPGTTYPIECTFKTSGDANHLYGSVDKYLNTVKATIHAPSDAGIATLDLTLRSLEYSGYR